MKMFLHAEEFRKVAGLLPRAAHLAGNMGADWTRGREPRLLRPFLCIYS